jgi:hypothetical protein
MKRIVVLAVLVSASSAAAQSQTPVRLKVVSRSSVESSRSWQTAGTLVELVSTDPAARLVRIKMGDREQTLVMGEGADAGFQALAAGGPVFLSWRFNRQARPEATLRITEGGGTVTLVGWPAGDAGR